MGTQERRKRDLESRRQLILDKSRELFFERGYENVTVQDICDAVEYGRSAVYAIFESKEEIYANIYLQGWMMLADLFQSINPDSDDFDREFMRCVDVLFEFYNENRLYYKALFYFNSSALAFSKIPTYINELREEEIARAIKPFYTLLEKGIGDGYIKEMDIMEFIYLYWIAMVGVITYFILRELEADEETIRLSCLRHAQIYLEGIKNNQKNG